MPAAEPERREQDRGRDAKRITLLSGAQDTNTPRAVERMIEVHLDIEDRRVSGEHRG